MLPEDIFAAYLQNEGGENKFPLIFLSHDTIFAASIVDTSGNHQGSRKIPKLPSFYRVILLVWKIRW